jgi:dTMP kinase
MQNTIIKNFIVFEGLDGAGTTTQSKLLNEKLPQSYMTREPTGSLTGEMIRKVLRKELNFTKETLAYLFAADRSEHLHGKDGIIDRCRDGQIVICDRYLFSSLAYQSLDMDFNRIYELNKFFYLPEVVFFLNTPITECQKRIHTRGENEEIFETFTLQEKILANYNKGFTMYKDLNVIYLDGSLPINILLEEELKHLNDLGIINK